MRIFKIKTFVKWAKKNEVTDSCLVKAVNELLGGQVDAALGAGLFKKRVATKGRGKRGSCRTIPVMNGNARFARHQITNP